MKRSFTKVLDFIAAAAGVFDVEWEKDFDDDGYDDITGRADIDEPIFLSDFEDNVIAVNIAAAKYRA